MTWCTSFWLMKKARADFNQPPAFPTGTPTFLSIRFRLPVHQIPLDVHRGGIWIGWGRRRRGKPRTPTIQTNSPPVSLLGLPRLLKEHDQALAGSTPKADTGEATSTHPHIFEIAADLRTSIPEEEWAKLPVDGAEQHDHYIYGTPKRPATQ